MNRTVRSLTRISRPRLSVCQTRLVLEATKAEAITQFELPPKVQALYDASKDGLVYGVDHETYLELKGRFPMYFQEYIEDDIIWDQTKTAMMKFMITGEVQPCTGAGLSNPIDIQIAKRPASATMFVLATVLPLGIGCFILTRQKFNRDKAATMKRIKHDIRKLKRDRAFLRAEVATNKDTIARLKSMD